MKKVFLVLLTVLAFGCSTVDQSEVEDTQYFKNSTSSVRIDKIVLEGHEYWVRTGSYAGGLEHSASCPCHDKIKLEE